MAINPQFDKITKIYKNPFNPGLVTDFVEFPATNFKIQDDCFLTKINASCSLKNAAGANIAVPYFKVTVNCGLGSAIIQSSNGTGNSLNLLSSEFHSKVSVLQNVELTYPNGLQVDKTGIVSVILNFKFSAALIVTDLLEWDIDFYFKYPEPITVLFEQA